MGDLLYSWVGNGHACIATFMATIKQLDNNDDFDSDNTINMAWNCFNAEQSDLIVVAISVVCCTIGVCLFL